MILWLFDGAATKLRPLFPVPPTLLPSLFLHLSSSLSLSSNTCINKSADTTEKKGKVSRLEGKTHLPADTLLGYINTKTQSHTHTLPYTHSLPYIHSHTLVKKNKALQRKTLKNVVQQKGKSYYGKERIKISSWMQLFTCVCVCVLQQQLLPFPTQAAFFTESTHTHTHTLVLFSFFPARLFCFAYFSGLGIIYDRSGIKLAKSAAWKMAPSAALIRHLQQRHKYKKRTLQQREGGEALPLAGIPCELLIFSVWFRIVARGLSN